MSFHVHDFMFQGSDSGEGETNMEELERQLREKALKSMKQAKGGSPESSD